MKRSSQDGFTLLELLVTMLVAGVVLGFGVPNLLEFSRNSRMAATTNDLVTALHLARSQAVKERIPVTLCASPNPVAASPTCSPDASGTNGGYVVWVDEDADAVIDSGEQVLYQRDDPFDISISGDNGYVHFGISGNVADVGGAGASATQLLFCDSRGNVVTSGSLSAARAIRIAPTGRPSMFQEVAEIAPIVAALGVACP